jgi:hypothetical protein
MTKLPPKKYTGQCMEKHQHSVFPSQHTLALSIKIKLNDEMQRVEKKQSCPLLRYILIICLDGLRKTTKISKQPAFGLRIKLGTLQT